MKPIAILGCGPAGLLAAHAVGLAGYPFSIFSKPRKSELGGAQFLHMAIPQLTSEQPEITIDIKAIGDARTYQEKVYGQDPTVPFVSFPEQPHTQQVAWNLIRAYDTLWGFFKDDINEVDITPAWLDAKAEEFDLIISSVPLIHLCKARKGLINEVHHFNAQKIWIYPDNLYPINGNEIIYDGTWDHSWYRCSRLFDTGGTEWSDLGPMPQLQPRVMALKPIATTCTCYPNMLRVGRHGTWKKGVLTHHAFVDALKAVLPEAS